MLRIVAGLLALLISSAAFGQSAVLQGGGWTAGRAPMYVGSGSGQAVVQDSGPAGGGASGLGFREMLLVARGTGTPPYVAQGTGPGGTNFCNYDAPTTNATGYHYLCMSPNATVAGVTGSIITAGSGGAASALPLYLCTNGTCVTPTGGIAGLTVGSTTIASGTSNGVLYNNAGVLGNTNSLASAVLVTNGSGVPSFSTSIPSGVVGSALSWFIVGSASYPTIQSAVTAASTAGSGYVWIPCGTYTIGTAASAAAGVNATNTKNVHIAGSNGPNGGVGQCVVLNYVGTGAAFTYGGSIGFEVDHLSVATSTGAKIFDGTTGSSTNTTFPYFHDMVITGLSGTTVIFDTASSVGAKYQRINMGGGTIGIRGLTGAPSTLTGQFAVNTVIDDVTFQPSLTTAAIQGAADWTVTNSKFQGQILGYSSGPAGSCTLLNWHNNWHGDATTPQPNVQSNCVFFNSSGNTYIQAGGTAITQTNSTGKVASKNDLFGTGTWINIGTGNLLTVDSMSPAGNTPSISGTPAQGPVAAAVYGQLSVGNTNAALAQSPLTVTSYGTNTGAYGFALLASDYATNSGYFSINKDSGVAGAVHITASDTGIAPIVFDSGDVRLGGTFAGTRAGTLRFQGSSSGTVLLTPQAAAGTPTLTLPTGTGTLASSATSPMAINATTGAVSITGAAGAVLAGAGPAFTNTPTLGVAGTSTGTLSLTGATSGTVTITPQTTAGSPTLTLPNTSGTLTSTALAPVTVNATTGQIACTSCVTSSGGGAITGTAPISVSAAGVVSINAPYTTLTASNGGIVYSGATNLAILAGTATARQMLQSGASTTPAWSTTTWPATSTANRILYSSSANVIGEITSANSSILVTDGSGVPSWSTTLPAHTWGGNVAGGGFTLNNAVIGNVTPAAGVFTTVDSPVVRASGTLTNINGGTGGNTVTLLLVGGSGANGGSTIQFGKNTSGTITHYMGHESAIFGGGSTSSSFVLYNAGTGGGLAGRVFTASNTDNSMAHASTVAATSSTTGSATFAGGIGVAGAIWAGTYVATGVVAVASLPACGAGIKGARMFVNNATATTFASTVAGGGANNVPVVCDGTNWIIGANDNFLTLKKYA